MCSRACRLSRRLKRLPPGVGSFSSTEGLGPRVQVRKGKKYSPAICIPFLPFWLSSCKDFLCLSQLLALPFALTRSVQGRDGGAHSVPCESDQLVQTDAKGNKCEGQLLECIAASIIVAIAPSAG